MANFSHGVFAIFMLSATWVIAEAGENKEDVITLPPFADTYVWHDFSVSKARPFSEDGRYRLVSVRKNGDVELIDCAVSDVGTKIVVAKPLPKKFKKGEPLPTVVVASSNFQSQSAKCRELRAK